MFDSRRGEIISSIAVLTAITLGLYLSSFHSYLLFHSLIEIATIAIGFTLFILTWNSRRFLTNSYLILVGIGYGFIALIDLLHTLSYKGMNIFPGFDANLPTQLWIAARSLQALTLCVALFFVARRVDNRIVFGGYAAAVSMLVVMVYSGNFPDCYIEGKGLTPFKINSEYAISAVLLVSLYFFYRKRNYFENKVFYLIVSSIACTVFSEISFTAYVSVYGFANLVGHFFKLAAFYLIYRAILVIGLREPFDLIFRDLKQAEEMLRKSHDTLEEKVRERTAELRASEEKYRALIESANDAIFIHEIKDDGMPGSFIEVNELACRQLGYSKEELAKLSPMELDDPRYRDRIEGAMKLLLKDGKAVFETAQIAKDGRSITVEVSCRVINIRGKRFLFSIVRDITERKRAEQQLTQSLREKESLLREIHHRVKNNMAVVSSLLSLQAEKTNDAAVKSLFDECRQRVKSMILVHEKLYQVKNLTAVNMEAYITSIISEIISLYRRDASGITVKINVKDIELDLEAAVPCGLIINELLANAFKYAFPDNRDGVVNVNVTKTDGTYTLTIKDSGVGLPKGFNYLKANTLGLQLVNVLAKQIRGTFKIKSDKGTEAVVTFTSGGECHGKEKHTDR